MEYIKKYIKNINIIKYHKDHKNHKYYIMILMIILIIFVSFISLKFMLKTELYSSIDTNNKVIFFGQTIDLDINSVGFNYSKGFELAFNLYNKKGGINGYQIKIILYNDHYDGETAVNNAKLLIDYFNVLCLLGTVGTNPTMYIIDKCIEGRNIPFIGPFASTIVWRKKFNKNIIVTNATFFEEFKLIIKNLLKNKISKIGIIYQNDIYGITYYNSFIEYILLNNYPIDVISSGKFERRTNELDDCYKSLFNIKNAYNNSECLKSNLLHEMQGVFVVCAEQQISSILGHLKKIKPSLFIYYNYFPGNSKSNYEDLEKYDKTNIYQTLLAPNLKNKYPIIYNKLTTEINIYNKNNKIKINNNNNITLEKGFIVGLMICEVLKEFKNLSKLNRDIFLDMFYTKKYIKIDNLYFGPFINDISSQGMDYCSLNQYINNDLVLIDENN